MRSLYMALIGATVPGRYIEQHDIYFNIAEDFDELKRLVKSSWPGAKGIHIDAWRVVNVVDAQAVKVASKSLHVVGPRLFFLNLGGYRQNEFEEFHYKMLIAAADKQEAIVRAKKTAFYKHTGLKGAPSHIDDKYGVDVDDVYEINDILSGNDFSLILSPSDEPDDPINLGYFKT